MGGISDTYASIVTTTTTTACIVTTAANKQRDETNWHVITRRKKRRRWCGQLPVRTREPVLNVLGVSSTNGSYFDHVQHEQLAHYVVMIDDRVIICHAAAIICGLIICTTCLHCFILQLLYIPALQPAYTHTTSIIKKYQRMVFIEYLHYHTAFQVSY